MGTMASKQNRQKKSARAKSEGKGPKSPSDRELLERLRTELAVLDRKVHDMKLYTQLRKWFELVRTFGDLEPLTRRVEEAMDDVVGRFEAGEYMTSANVERLKQRMDIIEKEGPRRHDPPNDR